LFNGGITKPNRILAELRRKMFWNPRILSYGTFYSTGKKTKPQLLLAWADVRNFVDAINIQSLDDPFVVAQEFVTSREQLEFRFFISKPRLITIAEGIESLQADSTNNLIWEVRYHPVIEIA